ncbi:MAG: helix-turn-helix transcriptional regulator [Rhodospirillales bacterium]|nr:helix-turn-helix transcriptional regulator [Rhodospirillales bacterium]
MSTHIPPNVLIGLRLKSVRLALGVESASAFAQEVLGIEQNRYSQWETGTRLPKDLAVLTRLHQRTGVGADWLYFGSLWGIPHPLADRLRKAAEQLGALNGDPVS